MENLQSSAVAVKSKPGIDATALKIIGIIAMTADHVGYFLFPKVAVFRWVGRIAYPIFAYMIAEGCRYTKNKLRYFLSVFGVGIGCALAAYLAAGSLCLPIFVTFACSIALIFAIEKAAAAGEAASERRAFGTLAALLTALYFSLFELQVIPKLEVDYGFFGILTPVLIRFGRSKGERLLALAIGLCLISTGMELAQLFSLAAVAVLTLYSGERGRYSLKWFFYGYYPLHIAVLYGIAQLV